MRISDWSSDVCSSDLDEHGGQHGAVVFDVPHDLSSSCREGGLLVGRALGSGAAQRSEEHTSELQSLMRSSYAVFCLNKNSSSARCHHLNLKRTLNITTNKRTNYKITH